MRVLGVDLAWGLGSAAAPPNETGVVAVEANGTVVDAGWTRGVDDTAEWMATRSATDAVAMVDAPLVVRNATGQRACEREVGRRYGRWKVSANSTNLAGGRLAGVLLAERLAPAGWRCADGRLGPPAGGLLLYEVFPYTTLVGAAELGYERERPAYKRRPRGLSAAEHRAARAATMDELVRRLVALRDADPPIHLHSHPVTRALAEGSAPSTAAASKHREHLVDAVLCAWTGLLWLRHGLARVQVLGDGVGDPPAAILAPARPEQTALGER